MLGNTRKQRCHPPHRPQRLRLADRGHAHPLSPRSRYAPTRRGVTNNGSAEPLQMFGWVPIGRPRLPPRSSRAFLRRSSADAIPRRLSVYRLVRRDRHRRIRIECRKKGKSHDSTTLHPTVESQEKSHKQDKSSSSFLCSRWIPG